MFIYTSKRHGIGNSPGFTIVELLIVIVVIAILAAISVVSYTGIQERARFAAMRHDLASLHKALQLYHADNGGYPVTPAGDISLPCSVHTWCGFDQATGDDFIPGISPEYITETPQLPGSNSRADTYVYRSDGTNYKLIRLVDGGLPMRERAAFADMMTTDCPASINDTRWGYWNTDISKCW